MPEIKDETVKRLDRSASPDASAQVECFARPSIKKAVAAPLIATLLAGCLAGAGVFASYTDEFETRNAFAMDVVDIKVSEEFPDGKPEILTAEQEVVHAVDIVNDGAACFIRCKSTFEFPTEDAMGIEYVNLDSTLWLEAADGYVYYLQPLREGESLSVTELIRTPVKWDFDGISSEGHVLTTNFIAEAVQAANFEPDFTSDKPWGNVVVEEYASADAEL